MSSILQETALNDYYLREMNCLAFPTGLIGFRWKPNPHPQRSGNVIIRKDSSFRVISNFRASGGWCSCNLSAIVCVTFDRNGRTVSINCLLDTESARTYLFGEVLLSLCCSFSLDCDQKLSTLRGECERRFKKLIWASVMCGPSRVWCMNHLICRFEYPIWIPQGQLLP